MDVKNHATLATNLVSYWELEESSGTRYDSHGSNDLTDNNTVLSATGIQGNGADFEDSNSEYLTDVNTGQYDVTAGSFSFWVKPESLSGSVSPGIISTAASNTTGNGFTIRYSYVDKKINFYLGGNVSGGYTFSTTALTVSNWYHVVCTWNSSSINVYVNGSLEGTDSSVSTMIAGTNLHIGKDAPNARYFDGIIDEIGFWDKVLNSTEVSNLYNSGAGIPYDAGGTPTPTPSDNALSICNF